MRVFLSICLFFAISFVCLAAFAEDVKITFQNEDANTVAVYIGGELFTKYVPSAGNFPMLFPIKAATGEEVTRGFPMRKNVPHEAKDHPHHRSLWLTHGNVNGVNFWNETINQGKIVFKEFVKNEAPVLAAKCEWQKPDGEVICADVCTMTFGGDAAARWVDLRWEITAGEKDVTFSDTKEGTFAVRVAGTMKVTEKLGGAIIDSEGRADDAAWGKRAAWVDYHGPVGDKTLGIAMMNHPKSDFYPTYWHVRTYGLFAANPFGVHDFTGDKNKHIGDFTLPAGKTMTLLYRVFIHPGDEKEGRVAENFEEYSKNSH